jgi:[histone H3]-lysine4 N-trimethyltransferase ATXR3
MQGLGVVCNKEEGFSQDDFVVEFLGEVRHHMFV